MNHASHEFQSITHEQWESGVDRHQCGLCQRDYGDPIHCASSWSLVVVIEDCYIPEFARGVIELAANTPTETNYAVIHALAVFAEVGLVRERLN